MDSIKIYEVYFLSISLCRRWFILRCWWVISQQVSFFLILLSSFFSHVPIAAVNGEGAKAYSNSNSLKTDTVERATQTQPWSPTHDWTRLASTRTTKSLSLEDALTEGDSLIDEALVKASRESLEEDDSEEREGDKSWLSTVEESIQPTTVRSLQKQQSKSSEDSQGSAPQTPTSCSPAPPKEPVYSGPLTTILEGEKTLCVQTQSTMILFLDLHSHAWSFSFYYIVWIELPLFYYWIPQKDFFASRCTLSRLWVWNLYEIIKKVCFRNDLICGSSFVKLPAGSVSISKLLTDVIDRVIFLMPRIFTRFVFSLN